MEQTTDTLAPEEFEKGLTEQARNVIFEFLTTVQKNQDAECGMKVPDKKLIDQLDRELMEPFLQRYPKHSLWILQALKAANNGEHLPPVKNNDEIKQHIS